jgi:hypothetical protein
MRKKKIKINKISKVLKEKEERVCEWVMLPIPWMFGRIQ